MEKKQTFKLGCMMAFFDFPELKNIHAKIDPKDIYTEEGDRSYGLENESHVTLLYGIHSDEVTDDEVFSKIEDVEIGDIILTPVSLFENEKYDVLKITACNNTYSDKLIEANKKLKELPNTNDYPDYKAHCTIAYLKPGTGQKYVDLFNAEKYTVTPNKIVYSKPSGEKIEKLMKGFNEDDIIQDLMKAQLNTDPSHGGKLVKKQITDKTGKKTTKWVSKQEAEQLDKKGGQEKPQDPTESIKYIDALPAEEKAKLELVKEHIDSGDMTTAKELASKLSKEAKAFIPKDVWKDVHLHKDEEVKKENAKNDNKLLHQLPSSLVDKVKKEGFNYSQNSMYGEGVYFSNKQAYGDKKDYSTLEVSLKPHKVLKIDRDIDVPKVIKEITGFDTYSGSKTREALIKEGYGSIEFPTEDGEKYTLVLDKDLIQIKDESIKKSENMNIIDKITSKTSEILGKIKNLFVEKKQDLPNHYTHVIVFNDKFQVLLLRRSNNVLFEPEKWWLPGGHLDANEEAMFGAQRELLEETNIDNIQLHFLHDSIEGDDTHHTYGGIVLDNPLIVLDTTEHSDYAWVNISQLSSFELVKGKQKQLEELIKLGYNKLGYEVIKDAFEQKQVTEDQFLLALKRSQISN